jgi:hypothetical protein
MSGPFVRTTLRNLPKRYTVKEQRERHRIRMLTDSRTIVNRDISSKFWAGLTPEQRREETKRRFSS